MKYLFYLFQLVFIFCFLAAIGWIVWKKARDEFRKKLKKYFIIGFILFQALFIACVAVVGFKGWRIIKPKVSRVIDKTIPFEQADREEIVNDFESIKDVEFFEATENTRVELSDLNVTHGKKALKVFIPAGDAFPGLSWEVFKSSKCLNWRAYRYLALDVYNESDQSVNLNFKIKSNANYPKSSAERHISIGPGESETWQIDLHSLRDRGVNLGEISYMKIYVSHPKREYVLYIDNIRLTPGQTSLSSKNNPSRGGRNSTNQGPLLLDFEDETYKDFFAVRGGAFAEIRSDYYSQGTRSLYIDIPKGSKTGGLFWEVMNSKACQDWSGYAYFAIDVYNVGESSLELNVKIKSNPRYPKKTLQKHFKIAAGEKAPIVFDLEGLKEKGLDIKTISYINIFSGNPKSDHRFYLDNMRLTDQYPKKLSWKEGESQNQTIKEDVQSQKVSETSYQIKGTHNLIKLRREKKHLKIKNLRDDLSLSLAGNEYEACQLVLYGQKSPIKNARIRVSNLVGPNGAKILSKDIQTHFIGYVETNRPYYQVDYVGLWPDIMLQDALLEDIPVGVVQPVWITVHCPTDTPAGEYKGFVYVSGDNIAEQQIPLNVTVWDFNIPKKGSLKTAFDFYGYFIPRYYTRNEGEELSVWENRVENVKDDYYKNMYEHRISPLLNIDPTNTNFSSRIQKYAGWGMNAFSIGKNGGTFGNRWPDSQTEIINTYRSYAKILKTAGLIEDSYIYTYDEPKYGNPRVSELCRTIHEADPDLNNMVCIRSEFTPSKQPDWGKDIDIWCVHISRFDEKEAEYLKAQGKDVWIYVSGPGDDYPGIAIDFSLLRTRIVPWVCWKYDVTGYLYWCVNFWEKNPWKTTAMTPWDQNGNGSLYYPGEDGPVGSIRLEAVRDGLEDYEYFVVLREYLDELLSSGLGLQYKSVIDGARKGLSVDSLVKSTSQHTHDPEDLYQRRAEIAGHITKIKDILTK